MNDLHYLFQGFNSTGLYCCRYSCNRVEKQFLNVSSSMSISLIICWAQQVSSFSKREVRYKMAPVTCNFLNLLNKLKSKTIIFDKLFTVLLNSSFKFGLLVIGPMKFPRVGNCKLKLVRVRMQLSMPKRSYKE